MTIPQEFIDKRAVAARLDVSTKTVERYMRRAENPLPFRKPYANGAVRYWWPDVVAWSSGTLSAPQEPDDPSPEPRTEYDRGQCCAAVVLRVLRGLLP